jgi:hypothetical protein
MGNWINQRLGESDLVITDIYKQLQYIYIIKLR